jgi:L-alanine-DL-glutamate epimerase-like enolase superfamily enzyme
MSTIADVKAFPLCYQEPHDSNHNRFITLARITTDDGVVGWGEAISQWPEAAVTTKTVIDMGFAPLLLGEDPSNPRRLWERMRGHAYWHGHGGIVSFAISALDIAVWDVAGKLAGLPVSKLLGGRLHEQVRACSSVILETLDFDALRDEWAGYRERGFTAFKGGWGHARDAQFGMDPRRDLAIVELLRETVGPECSLAVDVSAHAGWTSGHAVAMARRFEPYGLGWLEDALHHDDHDGWRRLRASVPTTLATGERCWTMTDYKRLVRSGGVDIVLVDPGRVEGISAMKSIVDDAAAHGVKFVPHSWSSAVNTAAAIHVFASASNGHVFEIKPNLSPMQHELVATPIDQRDGWITVPDAPGLGIEIDEATVVRYAFDPT